MAPAGSEPGRSLGVVRPQLPVSGAWRPGDAAGGRQFARLSDREFVLEGGGILREIEVAYETWGELSPAADNAILVCHALTGDSHAAGDLEAGHATPGWWDGKAYQLDTGATVAVP